MHGEDDKIIAKIGPKKWKEGDLWSKEPKNAGNCKNRMICSENDNKKYKNNEVKRCRKQGEMYAMKLKDGKEKDEIKVREKGK